MFMSLYFSNYFTDQHRPRYNTVSYNIPNYNIELHIILNLNNSLSKLFSLYNRKKIFHINILLKI